MKSRRAPMSNLFIAHILLMIITYKETISAYTPKVKFHSNCPPSSCGSLNNISYPFRLTTDPMTCGEFSYQLRCENNHTVLYDNRYGNRLYENWYGNHRYENWHGNYLDKNRYGNHLYVEEINYHNYTIRVVDSTVKKDNCSSIPIYPMVKNNFTLQNYYHLDPYETEIRFVQVNKSQVHRLTQSLLFLSCQKPVKNSSRRGYIDTTPCINGSAQPGYSRGYSYVVVDSNLRFSDLEESCRIEQMSLISTRKRNISSYRDIHNELAHGFELSWMNSYCTYFSSPISHVDNDSNRVYCYDPSSDDPDQYTYRSPVAFSDDTCGFLCGFPYYAELYFKKARVCIEILSVPRIMCAIFVIGLLIYKWRRRHLSMYDGIEEFLQSHNNLMPIRYSYWEIRMMTRDFKEKLGEGGFGSVYKGKLSSGRFVAIKLLGKSKANGQDFINEVATIGRIHHVNVVQLIGFCVSGSKRALVYDFMPNGSLDKHIFSREGISNSLSYKEIFEISLGVARGIEYLHQGCEMQILHFDIKPHNILLDENFIPKVSDFGLARLCPLDKSIVSLTAARGTIGYIAPELFYKNIGGVSHKADIYSFGMLLLEMANKRKNLNANAENSSQIYFPLWIYDQFSKGEDMEIEDATAEESETVKKMSIVALWCIQLKPCDRPSMKKVIEMLEAEIESLQMPPKLYLSPQEQEQEKCNGDATGETSRSPTSSDEGSV